MLRVGIDVAERVAVDFSIGECVDFDICDGLTGSVLLMLEGLLPLGATRY